MNAHTTQASRWRTCLLVAGLLALALAALVAGGCGDNNATPAPVAGPSTDTPPDGGTPDPPAPEPDPVAPLSFFELKLVGKWTRYLPYDGTTIHFNVYSDRTACNGTSSAVGVARARTTSSTGSLTRPTPCSPTAFPS